MSIESSRRCNNILPVTEVPKTCVYILLSNNGIADAKYLVSACGTSSDHLAWSPAPEAQIKRANQGNRNPFWRDDSLRAATQTQGG